MPPTTIRKTGSEQFHSAGAPLGFDVLDFWQWADSDLLGNALRGRLAEYLVARALGIAASATRTEWDAFDLRAPSGLKIEVKSAAYVQSWSQSKPSTISFAIGPTLGWDASTNTSATVRERQADVYVFALLHHRDRTTVDVLDTAHWEFYVLSAAVLDAKCATQRSLALSSLLKLGAPSCSYAELAEAVAAVGA